MTRRFHDRRPDGSRARRFTRPEPQPALLGLQRSAGNQAVTRLIQRTKESKELMQALGAPLTLQLEGEEIETQDSLADALDAAMESEGQEIPARVKALDAEDDELRALPPSEDRAARLEEIRLERQRQRSNAASYKDATFIGAIVMSAKEDLLTNTKLVDLPSVNTKDAKLKQSLAGSAFHLVQRKGLSELVVKNTLTTMAKAKQLEYLIKAGLPDDKHAIVIEIHYYPDRPATSTKLHKDTRGETLFVNLSFTNKRKILGPEYIVNPASDDIYDQAVKKRLPEVFVEDLQAFKAGFKGKRFINATVLEENGIVAFVDEAIHHKTPTPGHRTADADGLDTALTHVYGDAYLAAKKAHRSYKNAYWFNPTPFSARLVNTPAFWNSDHWWALLEKLSTLGKQNLDRDQLAAWLPAHFAGRAEELLEQAATDFTSVSVPLEGAERVTIPVREKGEAPLKRQMSIEDLSAYKTTNPKGGKRAFFRTWVRAVPRANLP